MHDKQDSPTAKYDNFDFSSVIAVAMHDMKNSLSLLLQAIEQLGESISTEDSQAREGLNSVHYEAKRMNTTLVQVLSLYRADLDALPLNVDEYFLSDIFEEVVDSNSIYMQQKDLTVRVDVDHDLSWYMDKELIFLLVHDVIINAIRYGCQNITISSCIINKELMIEVKDDGDGYPQSMLDMSKVNLDNFCISEGRTGLGLFFARLIAKAHKNKKRSGRIELMNDTETGGSVFQLYLP